MRDSNAKIEWGQVEKIGKGTKANYDSGEKLLTFCFTRGPETSGEVLRKSRELLMNQLKTLGYESRMKYNGEVIVEHVEERDVILVKKNHKLLIHLNKKQVDKKFDSKPETSESIVESQSGIKFS